MCACACVYRMRPVCEPVHILLDEDRVDWGSFSFLRVAGSVEDNELQCLFIQT